MEMEMEMKMESLLHRDRDRGYSLLEPAPRDPFGDLIGLSKRRSEVDFGDVFGGPPRNTSVYELRRSLGTGNEEVQRSPGRPWASLGERPVFGECFSPSTRRKDLGDDFFRDIFKGSEGSACSTPRMMPERDSTSSSRVLSPARSLPPRSEVFGGGASLLSQLSFSKKIKQEQENPISSPGNSSPIQIKKEGSYSDAIRYMPTAANHVGETRSEQRATRDLFHQSSFSSRFSNNKDWSTETVQSTRNNNERQVKENSNGSKVSRNGQFHFSIYKWASKGVMLVVPSNSKERNKHDSRLSGLPVPFLQGVDLPSSNKIMPTSYPSESENQVNGKPNELCAWENSPRNSVKDLSEKNLRRFEAAPDIITLAEEMVNNRQVMDGSAKNNSSLLNISEQVLICMQEKQKSVPLDRDDVINDHYESYEKKETKQEEDREDLLSCATSTRSADDPVQCRKRSTKEHVGDQSIAQDVPLAGGRVKGKVKEFIKIFNQDISCKPINIVDPQSWNSKVHDISKPEVKDNVQTSAIKETNRNIYGSKNGEDGPIFIEPIFVEDKPQSYVDNNGQRTCGSSNEKEEESTEELSEALYSTTEEIHYEVEEFMVEDILEEHTELPQKDSDLEVIQQLDAKIRTWSAGKEGNIRSLLSTLQYILWEGSGWKPVALVDIIEGNSVKRAYQRALLCLHPDKLQQRGTPMHLRYIAEKVFDILQESWDHFNTLSAL